MIDYRGKTVWITGASSGIGAALAVGLAKRGATLILSARRLDKLEATAGACRKAVVHLLPMDVAAADSLAERTQRALAFTGQIDIMVHNAGVGQRSLAVETALDVDRSMMETNFFGPVAITKHLLPSMRARGQGTIVVMSSVLGVFGAPRRSGYAASKHALHGYFDSMRAELQREGIRVLMVCPGRVKTEFSQNAFEGDGARHGQMDASSYAGLSAERVAERTVRALDRSEQEVIVAKWETLPVLMKRVSPGLLRRALARADLR
jgi:short-subunit dehydrogenase